MKRKTLRPPRGADPEHIFKRSMLQRHSEAHRRRVALLRAGLRTYTYKQRGPDIYIVCLCCTQESPHPEDVKTRFCAFCVVFHDDPMEVSV